MNKELREELEILKAASLMDSKAPVRLDNRRARNFVAETLGAEREQEREESSFSRLADWFRRPAVAWGGIATVAVACAACLMVMLPKGGDNLHDVMPGIESVHAAADSLADSRDSLKMVEDDIEIISVK